MPIFEFFIFAYGVYLIFAYSKMLVTKKIPAQLISKKVNLERAKDVPGYINNVAPKGIAFGTIEVICAFLIYLGDMGYVISYVSWGAEIFFFISLIVFAFMLTKIQNKYLY